MKEMYQPGLREYRRGMGKGTGKLHRVPLLFSSLATWLMGPTLSHKRDLTHDLKVVKILMRSQAMAE